MNNKSNVDFEKIGKRIHNLRIEKNLTQEYLSQKVGVNVSHISNIENNRVKISLSTLIAVANALNVTVDYLLEQEYRTDSGIDSLIIKKLENFDDDKKERLIKIMDLI